jgi:hypothetical protein
MENLKLLFQLYFRPASAMSEIIDKGSWLFAAVTVLLVSVAFTRRSTPSCTRLTRYRIFTNFTSRIFTAAKNRQRNTRRRSPIIKKRWLTTNRSRRRRFVFSLFLVRAGRIFPAAAFALDFLRPAVILLLGFFGGAGGLNSNLGRDYGTLAVCSLMAWAAAHLPFALAGITLSSLLVAVSPLVYFSMWLASGVLFGVLMIFALRVVFGTNYGTAVLVVGAAWLALSLGMYVFRYVSPWLFSPFLLVYAYIYFGGRLSGEVRGFGNALRQKQNFKRFLHNATVNPKDADAHVQLALIYLQRKQEAKALEHLNKTVEIDAGEIDANYELGKIARQNKDLQKALNHFSSSSSRTTNTP